MSATSFGTNVGIPNLVKNKNCLNRRRIPVTRYFNDVVYGSIRANIALNALL